MGFASVAEYEKITQNLKFNQKALIGGKLVDALSGKTFETVSPSTGQSYHHGDQLRARGCGSGGEGRPPHL